MGVNGVFQFIERLRAGLIRTFPEWFLENVNGVKTRTGTESPHPPHSGNFRGFCAWTPQKANTMSWPVVSSETSLTTQSAKIAEFPEVSTRVRTHEEAWEILRNGQRCYADL